MGQPNIDLRVIHKLRVQDEIGTYNLGGPKIPTFCERYFYKIENVNTRGNLGGQKKSSLVNVVCERPLIFYDYICTGVSTISKIDIHIRH